LSGCSFGEDETLLQGDSHGIHGGARFTRVKPFAASDIHAANIDHGPASYWRAWHWFRVELGGRRRGGLLVHDGALRDAHGIGEPDSLRREIADRLNALVDADGSEAVVALLQEPDVPVRLEDLRQAARTSAATSANASSCPM
jgi:hypothetical protein